MDEFVGARMTSEGAQLDSMVRFMTARGMEEPLQRKDWLSFVRMYNGHGLAALYAQKLEAAYKGFQAK